MENMLLVGLSRQLVLERQMDVVANNVANINTTGFKADKSLFQEYLMPVAHEDTFTGNDRRISYVQDRATFHDLASGPLEQTQNPLDVAIDGNAFLVVQTPAGERYTRDGSLQINFPPPPLPTGNSVLGTAGPIAGSSLPTSKSALPPTATVTVIEGTNRIDSVLRPEASAGLFAQAQRASEGGLQPVLGRRRRCTPGLTPRPRVRQGYTLQVQRQRDGRDEPHDRGHSHLYADLGHAAAARATCANPAIEKTRRRSGLKKGNSSCALFIPQRPGWWPRNSTSR